MEINIHLTYQIFFGQKGEKIMSTNDPKEPQKVDLIQQVEEEGSRNASGCCGGGGNDDDCCGDGDGASDDCCG